MIFHVDPHAETPVYRQLIQQIRLLAASGKLKAGDELPSTRALSNELGVNPMTVSKAFSFLEMEGVVERRPGRPLVVKKQNAGQKSDLVVERLKEQLRPAVRTVKQTGFDPARAVTLFERLLKEGQSEGGKP